MMVRPQEKVLSTWNVIGLEDDSDLTDLTSDDDELDDKLEPTPPVQPRLPTRQAVPHPGSASKSTRSSTREATQKSRARTDPDKFPLPCLTRGRILPMTAWGLYELIKQGKIDLNPEYQRGVVWTEAKQSSFINTLFHHFHAPQILFSVTMDENGALLRTCIDGKQRLTSICAFFDGNISLKPYLNTAATPKGNNRNYWFQKDSKSRTRTLLPSHVMDNLKNTVINCVEYDDLSQGHEREMFQRVQFGVPLSPADRFPAINGPWADLVRELRNRINTTHGFEGYLDWGRARGKDFLALARIVYLAVKGTTRANEPSSARVEAFLHNTEGNPTELAPVMINTMDIFCRIAQDPDLGDPLTVNLSPFEFVMAGYLIYLLRTKLADEQLSQSISRMRERAKKVCGDDMKFNTQSFKSLLAFVREECNRMKKSREVRVVAADQPFERVESEMDRFRYNHHAPRGDNDGAKGKKCTEDGSGTGVQKRRRRSIPTESEDSEHDYVPAKKVKKTTQSHTTFTLVSTSKVSTGAGDSPARTTVKRTQSRSYGGYAPTPQVQLAARHSASLASRPDNQTAIPTVRPPVALRSSPSTRNAVPPAPLSFSPNATPVIDVVTGGRRSRSSVDSLGLTSDRRTENSKTIYSNLKFSKIAFEGQPTPSPSAEHMVTPQQLPSPGPIIQQMVGGLTLNTTASPSVRPPIFVTEVTPISLSPSPPQIPPQKSRMENCNKTRDPRLSKIAGTGGSNTINSVHPAVNRRPALVKQSLREHFTSDGYIFSPTEDMKESGPEPK